MGDFLKVIRSSTIILVFVLQGNSVAVENFSKKKKEKKEKKRREAFPLLVLLGFTARR